ncbi:bifunctional diaminohydroxyphosphoribosylaminopyrimidine deaminase/5-amino-6-(5-phosphoribosylamino)uracil reductase RibD [Pseudomonas alliivorans]|uniref:bifunctional diaminohydroxyphosphoribosylaminopyrimidine deaminase/5-amino-6-(5-phosphoribosylamino)uracil reductase RibD n=1 Tax=Pseudomonas alliivorans TaxID=2810613 RepID=UPI00208FFEF2|nr:bifunctional diaminohydroxyphosphoribosylaminopyrimidine deaminase/5-amino-6-(5-phosphoribosylamino)uracil reductase RibD [Pseudomonas alliivorans]MCO5368623.1 bifunctional diaminohydroxyphosphoribosylaminopyrimidine deaminase/5-amino-6-(5-phosphoribosylamino)uracil reductase RibD [Pseudomonas alliivorans]MEE4626405.1 bifunctional diaminohydroxyphosphoribosylaminopyrimidine deaminase/5-amino-6-(5-phosphoribosylamino)uracil reductase RibD [Pseudomonas alliivorans]MEE4676956.1 bifunctional diam
MSALLTEQAALDVHYMARALELARKGLYSTHPNPRVGCVIVREGQIVGEGWHALAGEPHAEVHALRQAGEQARGATAYVTLEPCSHHGRTPPCADALVNAGITRVVASMQDPNPEVAGRGLLRLMTAGIAVQCGVLEAEARALNKGFIKRMETGQPYVRVKLAMSLDGRTAMASGESQWITGPEARSAVQRLRAQSSVVLTGADTVLADKARLTVRPDELGLNAEFSALAAARAPLRVLIDGRLRVPLDAPFFQAGSALVATCAAASARGRYHDEGHEIVAMADSAGHVDLRKLLTELGARGVNEVLVEAGPRLAGAFTRLGLVDEFQIFIAGKFLGSSARPLLDLPLAQMSEALELNIVEMRAVGNDWRVIALPVPVPGV